MSFVVSVNVMIFWRELLNFELLSNIWILYDYQIWSFYQFWYLILLMSSWILMPASQFRTCVFQVVPFPLHHLVVQLSYSEIRGWIPPAASTNALHLQRLSTAVETLRSSFLQTAPSLLCQQLASSPPFVYWIMISKVIKQCFFLSKYVHVSFVSLLSQLPSHLLVSITSFLWHHIFPLSLYLKLQLHGIREENYILLSYVTVLLNYPIL